MINLKNRYIVSGSLCALKQQKILEGLKAWLLQRGVFIYSLFELQLQMSPKNFLEMKRVTIKIW